MRYNAVVGGSVATDYQLIQLNFTLNVIFLFINLSKVKSSALHFKSFTKRYTVFLDFHSNK